jgi:hypothetical protein
MSSGILFKLETLIGVQGANAPTLNLPTVQIPISPTDALIPVVEAAGSSAKDVTEKCLANVKGQEEPLKEAASGAYANPPDGIYTNVYS